MFDDWTVDVPQTYKMILKAAFGAQYKIEIRAPTSCVVSKQPAIVKKTHLSVYLIWATGIRWWRLCVNRKISNEIVVIKNCNFDVPPFFGGVKKSETSTNLGQLILYAWLEVTNKTDSLTPHVRYLRNPMIFDFQLQQVIFI